jgi:squalene synthase HpnC
MTHYENFPVASILCPKKLRPAVASLYWFARTADDLADEGNESVEQRLANLAVYRADLDRVFNGSFNSVDPNARWYGLFVALAKTIAEYSTASRAFPRQHLYELLDAFEKDVLDTAAVHRYTSRAELLGYCRLSANPVGRLMLYLFGVDDEPSKIQSDAICSALQLINFWQDVSIDIPRGRFYVPNESMQSLVAWTRGLMQSGAPLCKRVGGRFGFELRLVVQGGLRILDKIETQDFDTTKHRPKLTKWDAPLMAYHALLMS